MDLLTSLSHCEIPYELLNMSYADKKLVALLLVKRGKVDLAQHHIGCGLALEAVQRLGQHGAVRPDRVACRIEPARELAQGNAPDGVAREHPGALLAGKGHDGDVRGVHIPGHNGRDHGFQRLEAARVRHAPNSGCVSRAHT